MDTSNISTKALGKKTLVASLVSLAVMALFLFLPAGTIFYWQAWLNLALLAVAGTWSCLYLLKHDPALLARRIGVNPLAEPTGAQKKIQLVNSVFVLGMYALSAWDCGRSEAALPVPLVLTGDALTLLSLWIIFIVARENSYASALVRVESGQKVIDTGPYSLVRHPMYVGAFIYFLSTPPALGSLWGLIPSVLLCGGIVARLLNEERYLAANLPGYAEYMHKVKYRLIPHLW